ncbi:MAG: hypothetical protein AAGA91_08645 [Pseudomonadota bacterium]
MGTANAQTLADNSVLGDLAIVPYYTTLGGYSTGVSVINTSDNTVTVKIRLRRASDSMDALDFNVIMSPQDVWTGFVQADGEDIRFYTNDASCTAPALEAGGFLTMPDIYREGADEGYIEILGMGAADASQPISQAALHDSDGIPNDCARVRDNFFKGDTATDYGSGANLTRRGTIESSITHQCLTASCPGPVTPNNYVDTGNVLKVSYFIKSDETGTEFGDNAVHIADMLDGPSMTNQQVGINEGDLQGFDHPNLDGGAPTSVLLPINGIAASDNRYEGLRAALGAGAVLNDWSGNATPLFSVDTDWVITTPGQYIMTNLIAYIDSLELGGPECNRGDAALPYDPVTGDNCDFRDIPMVATVTVYDREERGIVVQEGDLVVSPQPPGEIIQDVLDQEVNVLTWGVEPVLNSAKTISVPKPEGAQFGWASLSVTPNSEGDRAVCQFVTAPGLPLDVACTDVVNSAPPLVGFVAWQRNFGDQPDANFGRIVGHSYDPNSP